MYFSSAFIGSNKFCNEPKLRFAFQLQVYYRNTEAIQKKNRVQVKVKARLKFKVLIMVFFENFFHCMFSILRYEQEF